MTKVDIISGFLGAGKTTLIKKLLEERAFPNEKIVLIENEYGEIGIDGAILKNNGIEIKELNSGCICCTIAGDFRKALKEMIKMYHPDRIIIEPSGVGKLSDVLKGCQQYVTDKLIEIKLCMTVIDAMKYKLYMKNFAEFYKDQLVNAKTILLSRTQCMKPEALEFVINDIKQYNKSAPVITTQWEWLSGSEIVKIAEGSEEYCLEKNMMKELQASMKKTGRSYHISELKITGSEQKGHHCADDLFSVWSKETGKVFDHSQLKHILSELEHADGLILRAKGFVRTGDNSWIQFDYVPGECSMKEANADFTGRICVIGNNVDGLFLSELFGI